MGRIYTTARPAVGGGIATIADLPGLKWWVEPDGIVSTGSTVTSWTDKSGNGNTIAESGSNRPSLVSSALNGFNGVQFVRASSQRLIKTSAPLIAAGGSFTFGIVMRVDASNADQRFISNSVSGTNGFELMHNGTKYDISFAGIGFQDANTIIVGGFHMFMFRVSNSAVLTGSYRYDAAETSFSGLTGFATPGAASLLAMGAAVGLTDHADMTAIAAFICSGHLEAKHVLAAESYWKNKYPGLP